MRPLTASVAAALLLLISCGQQQDFPRTPEGVSLKCLSLTVDDLETAPGTKSILTDPDIETKVTTLTLALYRRDGSLYETAYLTSGFDSMEFLLEVEENYTVYALANMGDMRPHFPDSITGDESLSGISYTIPGYTTSGTGINDRGIPMAGKLSCSVDLDNTSAVTIPLKRLLSKLAVDLSVHWDGVLRSIRICNLNGRLLPFGDSRATSASDILADEEIATGEGLSEGSFVFYVPENVQGSIPAIGSSADKSRDNAEAISSDKADLLSYLEVTVDGQGQYEGNITYRSYLGGNATSDFTITRNCRYSWVVDYFQDGTFLDDWKHENELAWWSYRYKIQIGNSSQGRLNVSSGDTFLLKLLRAEDRYERGSLKTAGNLEYIATEDCEWTLEDYGSHPEWISFNRIHYPPGVTYNYREYIALEEGSGYIRATLLPELGSFTDRVRVNCVGEREPVVLTVSPTSIVLGETVQFTATLRGVNIIRATYRWYLNQGIFGYINNQPITADIGNIFVTRDGAFTPTIPGTYEVYVIYDETYSNTVIFTVSEPD